ncbi:MAG: hypothetical protein ACJAVR_002360 [Paracoccaceae bacterium]
MTTAAACFAAPAVAAPAVAAMITSGTSGGQGAHGAVFDILIGADDLVITALELHLKRGNQDLELYVLAGGYEGFTSSIDGWTLWDAAEFSTTHGSGVPTSWDVADWAFSATQTYGIYVTTRGDGSMTFSKGTEEGAVAVSEAALTIFQGRAVEYMFDSADTPRTWNGSITFDSAAGVVGVSAVPLPGSLPLAMAGFAALAAIARRARRKA